MFVVLPLFVFCVCVYVVFWRRDVLSISNWQTNVDAGHNGGLSVYVKTMRWSVLRERCGRVWWYQTINAHDRCFEFEIGILMLMLDAIEVSLFPLCYLSNASLDFTASPFEIASPYSNLTYLLKCSAPINDYSQIDCANATYLGLNDSKASKTCTWVFHAPIQDVEPTDFTGTLSQEIKLLQTWSKGLWIKWDEGKAINDNCSSCQSSNWICVIVKMELIPRIASPVGVFCNLWYFYIRFGSYHAQELVLTEFNTLDCEETGGGT